MTDEVVFGFAICAWFRGAWKGGAKRRSSAGFDGQCGEDAVWWALMHIVEEWAEKNQRKRNRTDDNPGPTTKKPTTSGPPGQPTPSGQPDPLTPDFSIRTPEVNSTPPANPTAAANPTPVVHPPIVASPPVRPPPVRPPPVWPPPVWPPPVWPPPVRPLPVRPPPVPDTLGELFVGGLQGLDDYNPPAKWVAQS